MSFNNIFSLLWHAGGKKHFGVKHGWMMYFCTQCAGCIDGIFNFLHASTPHETVMYNTYIKFRNLLDEVVLLQRTGQNLWLVEIANNAKQHFRNTLRLCKKVFILAYLWLIQCGQMIDTQLFPLNYYRFFNSVSPTIESNFQLHTYHPTSWCNSFQQTQPTEICSLLKISFVQGAKTY